MRFDGPSLDANSWTAETGDDVLLDARWGNNEQEYYTNPPTIYFSRREIIIEARRTFGGNKLTSARIKTQK